MSSVWARPRTSRGVAPRAGARATTQSRPQGDARRTIPFEYSFRFTLGKGRGHTHRSNVTVSVEAAFVAAAVGYAVVPETQTFTFGPALTMVQRPALAAGEAFIELETPLTLPAFTTTVPELAVLETATETVADASMLSALAAAFSPAPAAGPSASAPAPAPAASTGSAPAIRATARRSLRDVRFEEIFEALDRRIASAPGTPRDMSALDLALRAGIRINPRIARAALLGRGGAALDADTMQELFEVALPVAREVPFLYALFDEGSGREFQSEPVLSIAGLGASDGKRPFRHFARPITFTPLSTIRMEVTELVDVPCDLYVSLHGFKVLGGAGSPTQARPPRRGARRR